MVHFLKLYSSFHKFVYHLELLKIFLHQYGKEIRYQSMRTCHIFMSEMEISDIKTDRYTHQSIALIDD